MSDAPQPTHFGVIEGEPISDYHATDACSHSKLEVFRDEDRGPRRYLETYITKTIPRQPTTAAMEFGQALDSLLLENNPVHVIEPETYLGAESQKKDAPMVAKPWNNNATACREWHAANSGKIVLTAGQIRLLEAMKLAVQANPDAAALLLEGKPQVTFRAKFRWFAVQVRPDKWHADGVEISTGEIAGPVIADLKTAEDLEMFLKNRKALGYDRQAALYRRVVREILADLAGVRIDEIPPPEFYFVVAYKSAPVDTQVFKLSDDDMAIADRECMEDLKYLHRCYEKGEWPGALRGITMLPAVWRKERKEIW